MSVAADSTAVTGSEVPPVFSSCVLSTCAAAFATFRLSSIQRAFNASNAACACPACVTVKQRLEMSHGFEAETRPRAVDRVFDFCGQDRTFGERILREHDVAMLQIRPLVRRLPRRRGHDLFADVVVQFVHGDDAVVVSVGGAGLEAFDQEVREQGILRVADDLIAFPRVLG